MPGQVCVGTAALIFREGKLLVMKRAGSHGAGQWAPPGGWVDKGEGVYECAVREVKEEVGLDVDAAFDVAWTEDFFPEGVQDVCIWILCTDDGVSVPRILEPDKCSALHWMTKEEIEALPDEERFGALSNFSLQKSTWDAIWEEYSDVEPPA